MEWKNGKLEKVLLASMDVTQEKKAEIESRQALKEAYRSAENANRAKTEFLDDGRAFFTFYCKDQGVGMSEDFIAHAFDMFS